MALVVPKQQKTFRKNDRKRSAFGNRICQLVLWTGLVFGYQTLPFDCARKDYEQRSGFGADMLFSHMSIIYPVLP